MTLPPVGIVGAGAIGTVCGLSLATNDPNQKVVLVGRKPLITAVEANGGQLRWRDKSRGQKDSTSVPAQVINSATLPSKEGGGVFVTEKIQDVIECECSIIIVATKSMATQSVGEELAKLLPKNSHATIFSFQNGVRNASILQECLKEHDNVQVLACMVGFNASWDTAENSNLFNKNTDGGVKVEQPTSRSSMAPTLVKEHSKRAQDLVTAFTANHLDSKVVSEIAPQMYSKLLINLFNPVNALAGVSTPSTLEKEGYRRVWAAAVTEGIATYNKKGIALASFRGLPPKLLPWMTVVPESFFWFVLRRMAKMDENARSSMLQDMDRRRAATEVDYLCGEIVRLGKETGIETPVNEALVRLVKEAEAAGKGSPQISAEELVLKVGL